MYRNLNGIFRLSKSDYRYINNKIERKSIEFQNFPGDKIPDVISKVKSLTFSFFFCNGLSIFSTFFTLLLFFDVSAAFLWFALSPNTIMLKYNVYRQGWYTIYCDQISFKLQFFFYFVGNFIEFNFVFKNF